MLRETRRGGGLHSPPPTILNSVKNDLAFSRPVETIKKEKYRFHYLNYLQFGTNLYFHRHHTWKYVREHKIDCFYLQGKGFFWAARKLRCWAWIFADAQHQPP